MRAPNDMPRRRTRTPGRGRVLLIAGAIILFVLVTSLRQIADFWTDYLWFDAVGFSSIWSRTLGIKVGLALIFMLLFFVLLWANLWIADRISPKFRPLGPDEELLNRYHQIVDRRAGALRLVVAGVFAVVTGAGMSSQWNEWVLFSHGGDFNIKDPQFDTDVGFYVFRLPFLTTVVDWMFASLIIVLLVTAVAHYLNGGIRVQAPFERVTPQVKAHLSVLLALLALTKAADYYLQRYHILLSDRGTVNGASYTEVNATLPALYLLLFIALASFLLFIVNIRRRGWVLPIVAVGLWVFVQLVVGEVYPAVYQRLVVQPEESSKEAVPIRNNIEATKKAYGLDRVDTKPFDYSAAIEDGKQAVDRNPDVTRNVQLLDTHRVLDTFQKLQSQISPLQFPRVSTDRYPMKLPDGGTALTQVVISNREMNDNIIPTRSWQSEKLNYTHGYGLALAAGNAVTQGGAPDFAVKDIPLTEAPSIDLPIDEPNNYYFSPADINTIPDYSIVNTRSPEFDYVRREGDASKQYTGKGGVAIDSFARRAAFWLKFGNFDLLISQYITDQSKILFLRDIRQRAMTAAPFLAFDSDPYPVVVDRHTVYVLDAYTTSDQYPNSQLYGNFPQLEGSKNLNSLRFNYVRNSVKVVVSTYDGSVTFYVVDTNDPIIAAYQSAFPELFRSGKDMSQDLRAHLRYPEDIFRVQTDMYGRYHINDPAQFYAREGAWEPPPAPPDKPNQSSATPQLPIGAASGAASVGAPKGARMAPYYVLNKLQGDPKPNFMLLRSFQPYSEDDKKNRLTSFMVARSDGDDLGRLQVYQTNESDQIDGPGIVSGRMLSDADVSSKVTLLGQQGSEVYLSDLIIVPIEKTIVYARSMYVVANQVPLVRYVIVYAGGKVYVEPTLRDALKRAYPGSNPVTLEGGPDQPGTPAVGSGGTPPTTPGTAPSTTVPSSPPGTGVPGTIPPGTDAAGLIAQANQDLADADAAYNRRDLNTYLQKVRDAQAKLQRAQELINQSGTTTTSTPAT